MEQQAIIDQTQRWVQEVVVKFNFCPFARPEVDAKRIRYCVVAEQDRQTQLETLNHELLNLQQNEAIATTLLIIPKGVEGFYDFLDLVDQANELITMQGFDGEFQLAHFHPDYCFADAKQSDPENYTNRSPYPVLHLLREAMMEEALEQFEHPEKIPERNIEYCRRRGAEYFAQQLATITAGKR
ncbi:DUF1415 domain-containing protein [Idiomarina sp. UBA3162]|uniref:DUF1415 domain-containing protein n=1 Tax=unclassified Idiomarina TaxID=2614829 RepID=UPI000C91527F|nr:DUF1415 domain-containing protein [Idiomarina sp. UBA3162]MAD53201.1 hypothetical protein [Idiomarinaceae bacterium]MEC7643770.1 DUF1415 domain-containing protein [Pseudomonadota bacterium]|tara:strand:+ start:5759 stop:6310 length:552 start_codon:yes stop_codon:yes gene_type:complete